MTVLRALASVARFPQRVPQWSTRPGLFGQGGLTQSNQSGYQAYAEIGAAYGPIHRLCQSVSLTDWNLYQQGSRPGSTTDRTLLDDATAPARYPATALWTEPNPAMTRRTFLFLSELWKIAGGGVYWLLVQGGQEGPAIPQRGATADLELWPIREDRITPVPDPDRYLAGYVYTLGGVEIPLPIEAVIPIGWPDPRNPLRFAGPLQAIRPDLEAERYASEYQRNLFLNQARPGGVIEFAAPLPRDRFEELVLRWREQHQGVNNAARVAIIEGGKWVDVGMSNQDMEYEKLRKLDRETVMFAMGMPFAVMQTNDVNLANATMADKQFFRWTLRPELEDYKEPLNLRVLPYLAQNQTMDYILPAPEDEAFDLYATMQAWLGGLITQNQALEALSYGPLGPKGERYLYEITGTPPPITAVTPPKRPTTLGLDGLNGFSPPALQTMVREARCPQCQKKLGEDVNAGARLHCDRCRQNVEIA